METRKSKFIRYAVSSGITFFTAALLTFLSAMLGAIDAGTTLSATMFFSLMSGAFTAGLRAVLKYLYEVLASMPVPTVE